MVCLILLVCLLFPQMQFLGSAALATGLVVATLKVGVLFYGFV